MHLRFGIWAHMAFLPPIAVKQWCLAPLSIIIPRRLYWCHHHLILGGCVSGDVMSAAPQGRCLSRTPAQVREREREVWGLGFAILPPFQPELDLH